LRMCRQKEQPIEYIHRYLSPIGGITMAGSGTALTGLWFDGQKHFAETLNPFHEEKPLAVFDLADKWLDLYFSGKDPGFTPPLSMKTTAFRKKVWTILLSIPYGRTMTYGEIAGLIARQEGTGRMSAQAVGGAIAHNAISLIIPCHRAVGAGGKLAGYAGGLEKKAWLLKMERRQD